MELYSRNLIDLIKYPKQSIEPAYVFTLAKTFPSSSLLIFMIRSDRILVIAEYQNKSPCKIPYHKYTSCGTANLQENRQIRKLILYGTLRKVFTCGISSYMQDLILDMSPVNMETLVKRFQRFQGFRNLYKPKET